MFKQNKLFFIFIITNLFLQVHRSWTESLPVQVKLISSVTATGGQEVLLAGLEFNLDRGWKIYAKSSNTSVGFPVFKYESENIKDIMIHWPLADVAHEAGQSMGVYKNKVILPLFIDVDNPNLPLTLKGVVSFVACHTQCVPFDIPVSLKLPSGTATSTENAALIKAYSTNTVEEKPWILILVLAFMGGFILNFMPCVLPVLSLKLHGLVKKHVPYKASFMSTFLGIMVFFFIYACIAIGLQQTGQTLGWGLHFQEPLFLVIMIMAILLFGASSWGFIHLSMPVFLQKYMNKMNQKKTKTTIYLEGFLSGIFATLLAIPCTAPFLGTALGYALTRGPMEILMVFMLIGLGFSAPYWVGVCLPSLRLPKPGPWLNVVSKTMGLLWLFSLMWLFWLLLSLQGPLITGCILGLTLIMGACLILKGRFNINLKILIFPAIIIVFLSLSKQQLIHEAEVHIHPFEPEKISEYIQRGYVVFVDITATWCTTCQVNKALALKSDTILKALKSSKVIHMQGDWTTKNGKIREYLARHKRYGIPFNQIFGPNLPEGVVLPELIMPHHIEKALKEAGYK